MVQYRNFDIPDVYSRGQLLGKKMYYGVQVWCSCRREWAFNQFVDELKIICLREFLLQSWWMKFLLIFWGRVEESNESLVIYSIHVLKTTSLIVSEKDRRMPCRIWYWRPIYPELRYNAKFANKEFETLLYEPHKLGEPRRFLDSSEIPIHLSYTLVRMSSVTFMFVPDPILI